ncbi:MAG: helix-turn-helix domain-containing protein [Deltaproteobacteria bacterium]|nr:helix-turn-helix domain-containing protein [Deltaproteobacteria bacterium]
MGKVESTIRSEILRLAKREARGFFLPLRRELRAMKLKLSRLSKSLIFFDRLAKEKIREDESKKLKLEASPEEVKASRFTSERIRKLRKKLGISQRELGILTGVTIGAVGLWEKGKFRPAMDKKSILVALRKLRKRNVKKILAEKAQEMEKKKPRSRKVKAARGKGLLKRRVIARSKRGRRKA